MTGENTELDNMVKFIDVILRDRAEQLAHREPSITADEALPLLWEAFGRGEFYLIRNEDDERMGWEATRTAVERIRLKRKHRRLVERWRDMQAGEVRHG